jgi:DnaJ-class molecular chaperone
MPTIDSVVKYCIINVMDNHYSTLGVAESASQEEIKSAYRKLAMQFHPDRNPGDAAAEENFKKINSAYAEIGEPDTRARYDQMRQFGGGQGNPFGGGGGPFGFNFHFGGGGDDINDIINQFFHQAGFGHAQARPRNRDFTFNLHLTLEEAFTGKQTPVQFNVNGQDYNLTVNIPAGIDNGTRIRYQGHGDKSVPNVPPGDLYIQIQILEHATFRRNGPHLMTDLVIDALDAIVGCEIDFKCIDGQSTKVTIPPGTQPGANIRLKERGMPVRAGGHPRGECIIGVHIKIPTNLNENEKEAIRSIIKNKNS